MESKRVLGFPIGIGAVVLIAVSIALINLSQFIFAERPLSFEPFNVSYDHRALIIDGRRRMLISAGIHYPRATPEMWPDLIAKSKEGGADVIQSYAFWNGHEPVRGQEEMQRFVKKMVDLMKQEMLFSWQGGPIILLQIENEYGNIESSFGQRGKDYVKWAARMAVGLGAGVPWVMCRQTDAPENIIDACNGFYCDGFRPNSDKKPALWTEDWNGWYAYWGGTVPHRPVQDNAFAVARFFQRGGSFQNYYMYFGGTNFGRTSGGPFYTTSYDYDAPIDEYGLLRQPKWGHLKDLHAAIKLCEPSLVSVDNSPQYQRLGPKQEAHVYHGPEYLNSNQSRNEIACSAFLANIDEHNTARVTFRGRAYTLPPWSVSILPDCENVAFNTAKVNAQISVKSIEPGLSRPLDSGRSEELLHQLRDSSISMDWKTVKEPVGAWSESNFTVHGILEHLNVTKDTSDYLWYITSGVSLDIVVIAGSFLSILMGLVFIYTDYMFQKRISHIWRQMKIGPQSLLIACVILFIFLLMANLQNYGAFLEKDGAGFRGGIKLSGLKSGEIGLSASLWTYQTYFDAPDGIDPVALDFESMGKGQAWVNGHNIGRFWSLVAPKDGCQETCDYRGAYNENKCAKNCGKLSQKWYRVPRSWLKSSDNLLVIFEETGGNPLGISVNLHYTRTICGSVSESDYPPLHRWTRQSSIHGRTSISNTTPEMQLRCDDGHVISDIVFASYGTPLGSCQHFSTGQCHADSSLSVVSNSYLHGSTSDRSTSDKKEMNVYSVGFVGALLVRWADNAKTAGILAVDSRILVLEAV
ncbi:hypothetical protein Syun_031139 [Stephania yunnanensis]|uniref:Beta-galactosidase n=1 Tax=Stephania yunnanensis TaxID=152371 RepID=A0AAP0HFV4_9MAGN